MTIGGIAGALAGAVLWGWGCVVFSLGLFKVLAAAGGANQEDWAGAAEGEAAGVAPPTPAESAAAASNIEQARAALQGIRGRDCISRGQWGLAALILGLIVVPWLLSAGEFWRFGAVFAALVFVVHVPWLALKDHRRYERYRQLRNGQLLAGILECTFAEYSPGGENPDYKLRLAYAFRTLAGEVITERFTRLALPANVEGNRQWPGPPVVPPFFAGFPGVGERVPVAILYVSNALYEIIGWRGTVLRAQCPHQIPVHPAG